MGSDSTTIVWFRRDLRIEDNPALAAAAKDGYVLPVFIWCPKEEGEFYPGRASRWWLKQSLAHLGESLKTLGAELTLMKAESTLGALLECVRVTGATKVVFNHLYDPVSLVRDHSIKKELLEHNVMVQSYNGDLLFEPWEVYDENGQAFTTFAHYWNKCLSMQMEPCSLNMPWRLVPAAAAGYVGKCSLEELGLENEPEKSSNNLLGRAWSPGWSNADKALMEFVEQHLLEYSESRVKVGGNSTSLLSPYLHFGELSVRKVFHCMQMKQITWAKEGNKLGLESITFFLRAIGLREYSRYLCFNFPFTHERSFLSNLKYFRWNSDPSRFKVWRQGRTGFPLVDAGMRELWATGWIHNRMRVIVSSFSVKFLLLPWRWGMKYFWDTLLDADLESDILGWQYISGSLPDGHDLHRLDDPEVQGSKYDPQGEYVRQWLPELARMPTEWIHHPWDAPNSVLRSAGVELGVNYPKPIVEIDVARESLSQTIQSMQEMAGAEMAETSNGTNEVVIENIEVDKRDVAPPVDNSVNFANSAAPRVALEVDAVCPCSSSRDQRVPTTHNLNICLPSRKRSKGIEETMALENANRCYEVGGPSRMDEDLCSTADSSSAKKQNISRASFCVPQACSMSSVSNTELFLDSRSSDQNQLQEAQFDHEHGSGE
ncbi:Cryptochrome-2-like protein [Drosera capensis]